jgi:enoyl-CoA hydratase/carnithine racemase
MLTDPTTSGKAWDRMSELLQLEHNGPIAIVTLDRSEKKNALSIALREAMSDTFDDLATRTDTKVVIVTGAGNVFSAGFDLTEFGDADRQVELWASSDRFHHTILRFPIPTIAAVNGPALAGGFDLACLCDIRIASTSARFAHPEQRWTVVLYRTLHDLVGGAIARDLVLTGRAVDADEARTIGLVVDVVPPDRLMDAAFARAEMIAEAPREALIATKAKIIAAQGIAPDAPTLSI